MKRYLGLILIMLPVSIFAQDLGEKVARNSINCFVGHSLAGSYVPRIGNRYLVASSVLVGVEKTNKLVSGAEEGAKVYPAAVSISEKEVGVELVYDFCPQAHELTAVGSPLGIRIDESVEELDLRNAN